MEPEGEPANDGDVNTPIEKPAGPPPLPMDPAVKAVGEDVTARPKRADEIFCDTCGTLIKINDLACPGCGKKVKKKGSLPGCAIAAIIIGFFFVAIAIMGILAAIAIPNFIAYRNKAVQSNVRTELHNVAAAQQEYYSQNGTYTKHLDRLSYRPSDKPVTIEIVSADENCFEAKGSSPSLHQDILIDCSGNLKEIDKTSNP